MRSIVLLVMLVAPALAEAPRKPWPRWTDWVRSYDGKLAWKNCTAPGKKSAAISLAATNGVMAVDLALAHPDLHSVALVSDDTGWTATQADLTLAITRPRANEISLKLALATGCTMKAQLRRATTNVPECDRLIGWARVERNCRKLAATPTENLARLVATKWTSADAATCTVRASELETALVDAGCAPHPNPLRRGRGSACTALQYYTAHIDRCAVPKDIRDHYAKTVRELMVAVQKADGPELTEIEAQCRDLKPMLEHIALQYRCIKPGFSR